MILGGVVRWLETGDVVSTGIDPLWNDAIKFNQRLLWD